MSTDRRRSALLVDDQALNHFIFAKLLAHKYDTVLVAMNADEAIKLVVREQPELIIVNTEATMIPANEVSKTLRAQHDGRFCKMIAIGDRAPTTHESKSIEQVFDRVYRQPIDYGTLHNFVTTFRDDV